MTEETNYMSDVELAKKIGVARITLRNWRARESGPPFYRLGRRIVYDWREVEVWIKARRVG